MFKCHICDNSFTRKDSVLKHLKEKRCKAEILNNLEMLNNILKELKDNIPFKENQKLKEEIKTLKENSEKYINLNNIKIEVNKILDKHINNIKPRENYTYKKYKMPSGKIVNYQGYENLALDELLQIYSKDDIENERINVPIIQYIYKNKEHSYYPDIYIKSTNTIIEIKSIWTYKINLVQNIIKALYTRDNKYNYEMWIYDKGLKKLII